MEKVSKFLSFGRIAGQIDSIEFPEEKIKHFRWERDGKDVLLLPDEDGKREKIYEEEGEKLSRDQQANFCINLSAVFEFRKRIKYEEIL